MLARTFDRVHRIRQERPEAGRRSEVKRVDGSFVVKYVSAVSVGRSAARRENLLSAING